MLGSTQEVWLLASAAVDTFFKGNIDRTLPEAERPIKDNQIEWLDKLKTSGKIEKQFNAVLFQSGDSREPEQAGIRGALMGSFFTLLVTFLLSLPIGVATAVYLEAVSYTHLDVYKRQVLALWAALQPDILTNLVVADLPTELRDLPPDQLNLVVNNLKNLVSGHFVSSTTDPAMQAAAERYQNLRLIGNAALWVVALSCLLYTSRCV